LYNWNCTIDQLFTVENLKYKIRFWSFQIYKHVYEYTICILIKQLFFDIRILISPLVSSNSSYYKDYVLVIIIFILLTISKFVLSCKISFCFGVLYCDLVWTDWFSNPHYLQHTSYPKEYLLNEKSLVYDIVVSVIWHYDNPTKHIGLVQSGPHHHLIELILFSP
jgi:hypothetical protein